MKLKELLEQYGEYEVYETKGEWCDASHITLGLKKPKPKTVWDLEEGDEYFLITTYGTAMRKCAIGKSDNVYVENGNVFLIEEEANHEIERRKVETLLLKYGGRRWFKKDEWNYYLSFGNNFKILYVTCTRIDYLQGAIYFDSEKQAKEAIDAIGSERIRKALFEVR